MSRADERFTHPEEIVRRALGRILIRRGVLIQQCVQASSRIRAEVDDRILGLFPAPQYTALKPSLGVHDRSSQNSRR